MEELYCVRRRCLRYLRKTFFTLNPIQHLLSYVCKHWFLKKLSNTWTLFLLHCASNWPNYAGMGSRYGSPHMRNLQLAASVPSPRAGKRFLTYKTNTWVYQTNGKGLDSSPISVLWNLLIFDCTQKTDLARSMFKTHILSGLIKRTQALGSCGAVANPS